jgi:mannose-6-phosphate isomerase
VDPRRIYPLRNCVKAYAWGSRTAIAALRGEPRPSPEPQAELWMGAHPAGPSQVVTSEGEVPLDAFIAAHPEAVLGSEVLRRFGPRLPFLLKVLAAEAPLSIQAHPSDEQAREGFARENAAGIALDAPARCYRDASAKPELICALSRFEALVRFRAPERIAAGLARIEAPELEALLRAAEGLAPADRLRALFEGWMALAPSLQRRVLMRAVDLARRQDDPDLAWVARLAEAYPADAGALAPIFLNRVVLSPGEALFLPAGELHSYLEGVGIEIMASSDNVLRGGLTPKSVNLPELLRVLRWNGGPAVVSVPQPIGPGELCYRTPAPEFELSVIRLAGEGLLVRARRGVEIALCSEGRGELVEPVSGQRVAIRAGEALLVPAALGAYRVEGALTVQRAAVGAAPTLG